MDRTWQPLHRDEAIGVVALSGPVDPGRLEHGLEELAGWGRPLVLAGNLRARSGYLAGSDRERVEGLREVVERGARVVIAARGGYGASRLLPLLPWELLVCSGVSLVGFSDLTAILNPLCLAGGAVQVHGPMAAAGLGNRPSASRLRSLLEGELVGRTLFHFRPDSVVRAGTAAGRAAGGNLAVLAALVGTPFQVDLDGCVLFLEEVDEPLYRLDRMLTQLSASGTLRRVKALIGGSLRGCRPASERSSCWRRLLEEVAPADAVVVVDLPFGHGARNLAFPIGAAVEVNTGHGLIRWRG